MKKNKFGEFYYDAILIYLKTDYKKGPDFTRNFYLLKRNSELGSKIKSEGYGIVDKFVLFMLRENKMAFTDKKKRKLNETM